MSLYTTFLRPLLFQLDAETAHHATVEACHVAGLVPGLPTLMRSLLEFEDSALHTEAGGLTLPNPIGLAAGWDKDARALRVLDSLGFGFAEIGSISARPSNGNPKPRLFRLPQEQAIIVNYGLPNSGAETISRRLALHQPRIPLGINVVVTNDGPGAPACTEEAILADYERSVTLTHRHAGYMSLNLSCPNSEGGQDHFTEPGTITRLLERLQPIGIGCPLFLKIPPNEDPAAHERLLTECAGFDFVRGFCFNLPRGKHESLTLATSLAALHDKPGAVSGKPVTALINRCIAGLYPLLDHDKHIIIGTGGVFSADDAYEKLQLGASLVQVYTAMIYEGPTIVKRICRGLCELARRDGLRSIGDAVGASHR